MRELFRQVTSDVLLSLIISVVIATILNYLFPNDLYDIVNRNAGNIFGVLASASSSLLGFIIAAIAITLSQLNSKLGQMIIKNDKLAVLLDIYRISLLWLATSCIVSLWGIVLNNESDRLPGWAYYVLLFLTVASGVSIRRCTELLIGFSKAIHSVENIK